MAQLSAVAPSLREEALAAYRALPVPGPTPGHYWKIDVSKLDLDRFEIGSSEAAFELDSAAARRGVVACDFRTLEPADALSAALAQNSVVDWRTTKFAALNAAYRNGGAFIFVPRGVTVDEPIVVRHRLSGAATFPYTLVVASEDSKVNVISRFEATDEVSFVSEVVEVVVRDRAEVGFTVVQDLPTAARLFWSRRGNVGSSGELRWAIAELGTSLSVGDVRTTALQPGRKRRRLPASFSRRASSMSTSNRKPIIPRRRPNPRRFSKPRLSAAVKLASSETFAFIGPRTGSTRRCATTRSYSPKMRISIASRHSRSSANDVQAYHGATIGAIDEEELFYAMSRGIDRAAAERMIALGFFEPALVRFPTEGMRDELRAALAEKMR